MKVVARESRHFFLAFAWSFRKKCLSLQAKSISSMMKVALSALLKKDVVAVETHRNEYSNIGRDGLSIFRIDFGATIQEEDGTRHLILIELQKTWLETETLRFRQYLGAQYANVSNMLPENEGAYAIPMVTVYLLGHKVGDIEEPVLYVRRQSYDYNDNLVTKGLPNPFVDSLTHDSIIVQIPRLHGQVNNRLEKVLSIFDQSKQDLMDKKILDIDESTYDGDADMLRIVQRLVAAASDAKIRHDMNVEDEFFSVIEKRDTDLMLKDKKIAVVYHLYVSEDASQRRYECRKHCHESQS